ncbi:MAG: hypothetical protein CFE32_04970, partial [Alphaproteobacteria bacterium PA3]
MAAVRQPAQGSTSGAIGIDHLATWQPGNLATDQARATGGHHPVVHHFEGADAPRLGHRGGAGTGRRLVVGRHRIHRVHLAEAAQHEGGALVGNGHLLGQQPGLHLRPGHLRNARIDGQVGCFAPGGMEVERVRRRPPTVQHA